METFFGRLKNEMLYGFEKDYPSYNIFVGSLTASSRVAIQLVA